MDRQDLYLKMVMVVAVGIWLVVFTLPDEKLHIWFFDVGEGDAIFIKTPENHQILIDGGPDRNVLSHLTSVMPFWDKSLDAVFVTHPHADHLVGVVEVLKRYRVDRVFVDPPLSGFDSPVYRELMSLVDRRCAENVKPKVPNCLASFYFMRGDVARFGEVRLQSLWPPREANFYQGLDDVNRASMVFELEYKNFRALFTGDAELSVEENPGLVEGKWSPIEVLKVPHQGSRGSIEKDVLKKLRPRLAVISVGSQNKFRHPSKEVLSLLRKEGVLVKRTDRDGTIEIIVSSTGSYKVVSEH